MIAGECRNGVPVIGEARLPTPPVESGEIVHQIDLVTPRRIADLGDRPDEYPLGAELHGLGAEEYPDRRLVADHAARHRLHDHALGLGPQAIRPFAVAVQEIPQLAMTQTGFEARVRTVVLLRVPYSRAHAIPFLLRLVGPAAQRAARRIRLPHTHPGNSPVLEQGQGGLIKSGHRGTI
jgi:hypothetical protein